MPGASPTPDAFREAMSRMASTVHVVTAQAEGRRYGITVTAACSLAADPMSVIICINQSASAHAAIVASGELCLNILGCEDSDLAARFAGMHGQPPEARFDGIAWVDGTHAPRLPQAVASLECSVASTMAFGTHNVFACRVHAIHLGDAVRPLLYARRAFCALEGPPLTI